MKIVKSKLSVACLSLGFVSVIGGISYAALSHSPTFKPKAPNSLKLLAKLAPYQTEVENYLDSMRSFLQTPPRDGVFGSDRIPTLHGKESGNLPAFEAIKNLEGEIQMRSAVIGMYSEKEVNDRTGDSHKASTLKPEDGIRVTDVHFLGTDKEDSEDTEAASKRFSENTHQLQTFAISARKKAMETYTEPVTIDGNPAWIVAKAVHASVNSCYKCHTNIKKGEPIGYTLALISQAAK